MHRSGPAIRVKPGLNDAFFEGRQHALPLLSAQEFRAARKRACVQAGHVALVLPKLLGPRAENHPIDTHSVGNFCIGQLTSLE
jgi:hypothetical protein